MNKAEKFDPPLDHGIARAVEVLQASGVDTFESCESGKGHAYPVPTDRFHGNRAEGFKAIAALMNEGIPVAELCSTWPLNDGEPTGPHWR